MVSYNKTGVSYIEAPFLLPFPSILFIFATINQNEKNDKNRINMEIISYICSVQTQKEVSSGINEGGHIYHKGVFWTLWV